MKTISILGSTGSIGTQTLEVVRQTGDFRVSALTAGSNIDLLEKQMREFQPALVGVMDPDKAEQLRQRTSDLNITVLSGMEGLLAAAAEPSADMVVTAVVGKDASSPIGNAFSTLINNFIAQANANTGLGK